MHFFHQKTEKERTRAPTSIRIEGRREVQKEEEETFEKKAVLIIRTVESCGTERTLFCSELKETLDHQQVLLCFCAGGSAR